MARALLLVAVLGSGCHAAFVDERPESARPAGIADQNDLDLRAPTTVGRGQFRGRAGHLGAGDVALIAYASGVAELRFDGNFTTSEVSGPVVVLTSRDFIGTALDHEAGDLEIAPLRANAGAQSYFLRDDGDRRNVFVYCKPYGIEVAKASLVATQ